jgi:hypothetical protein
VLLARVVGDLRIGELARGNGLQVRGFGGRDEVRDVDYKRVYGEDVCGVEVRCACCVIAGWGEGGGYGGCESEW